MDPNRPTFESVVDKVTLSSKMGAAGAKSFKSIAKSVLREGNSETVEIIEEGRAASKSPR
jgi:hypothetical protein